MDFSLPPELLEFQRRARDFYAREMAREEAPRHRDPSDLTGYDEAFERDLLRRAGAEGLLGVTLPEVYGGGGKPLPCKAIADFEASYHGAPAVDTAVTLAAAPLLAFGSEEQKGFFVPRMARGEVTFCIAYTEARAGSDLAALEMRAEPDGDGFVLNGEKVLVTGAHKADYCLTLARTDPSATRHRGISMFIVPMATPGVALRRRETMNRWTLSDIAFADVRVPGGTLLGALNNGFVQVAAALAAERSGAFHYGWAHRSLDELVAFCRRTRRQGRPLSQDPVVRAKLVCLQIELWTGLRFMRRVMWMQSLGLAPGYEASVNKVHATELLQKIAGAAAQALGLYGGLLPGSPGAPMGGSAAYEAIERVHGTIGAGTSEVHRNSIAQRGLGMPR